MDLEIIFAVDWSSVFGAILALVFFAACLVLIERVGKKS